MSERLLHKAVAVGLGLSLGIGATACSGGNAKTQSTVIKPTASSVPEVKVHYFSNGSRELILEGINDGDARTFFNGYGEGWSSFEDIYEWCDGKDLVEQTSGVTNGNGANSTSIIRTVGYAACADGRLTSSDFPPSPSESIQK